jgi:endonuclease/exonuclease/phosphatase family metal-dependent hydrolase
MPWYGPKSYEPWTPALDEQFRRVGITTLTDPERNFKLMVSAHLPGFGIYWYRRDAYLQRKADFVRTGDTKYLVRDVTLESPRIVLGDFNEWTTGLATRLLRSHMQSADTRAHLRRSSTYPGVLPFLHLDHIYYDPVLRLEKLALCRTRKALVASDHLPLIGEFQMGALGVEGRGAAREAAPPAQKENGSK